MKENFFSVLYHSYIQQIKLQETYNYQQNHSQYLAKTQQSSTLIRKNHQTALHPQRNPNPKILQNQPQSYQNKPYNQEESPNTHFEMRKPPIQKQREFRGQQQNHQQIEVSIRSAESPFQNSCFKTQNENNKSSIHQRISEDKAIQDRQIKAQSDRQIKAQSFQNEFLQENDTQNIVLIQCPMNCGRKFNQKALQKHVNNCQKVFQEKRKVFKVKVVDEEAEQIKKVAPEVQSQKKQGNAKWKKQSEALRNQLKGFKGEDDRIECGGCGRKFSEDVGKKHIPNCMKKHRK